MLYGHLCKPLPGYLVVPLPSTIQGTAQSLILTSKSRNLPSLVTGHMDLGAQALPSDCFQPSWQITWEFYAMLNKHSEQDVINSQLNFVSRAPLHCIWWEKLSCPWKENQTVTDIPITLGE